MKREADNRGGTKGGLRTGTPGPSLNPNDKLSPTYLPLPEIPPRTDYGHPPGPPDSTEPKLLPATTTTNNPTTPTTNTNPITTTTGTTNSSAASHVGVPKEVQHTPVEEKGNEGGGLVTNSKSNDPNKYYTKTTFASLNIQGLVTSGRQKKETILQFLRSENIEVLALQEHWLTRDHKFPESHLEGFRELRAVRPSRKRGGQASTSPTT